MQFLGVQGGEVCLPLTTRCGIISISHRMQPLSNRQSWPSLQLSSTTSLNDLSAVCCVLLLAAAEEEMADAEYAFDPAVGSDTDLRGDGGCVKTILSKGQGWETPEKGDEVRLRAFWGQGEEGR